MPDRPPPERMPPPPPPRYELRGVEPISLALALIALIAGALALGMAMGALHG